MPTGGVRVTGVHEFARACRDLGVSVDDMRAAFHAISVLGATTAAAYAPKRTGALASDIRAGNTKSNAVVSAGRKTVPYAGAINYGWGTLAANYKHGRYASGIKGNHVGSFFMQKVDAVWKPYALHRLKEELDHKIRKEGLE